MSQVNGHKPPKLSDEFQGGQAPALVYGNAFGMRKVVALKPLLLIGSAPATDLVIQDRVVSALHCLVSSLGGSHEAKAPQSAWQLFDLDSKNGTWVNRQRVARPVRLRHGDCIQVGRTHFMVVLLRD